MINKSDGEKKKRLHYGLNNIVLIHRIHLVEYWRRGYRDKLSSAKVEIKNLLRWCFHNLTISGEL